MGSTDIVKEYLVALGIKDNFTGQLDNTLKNATQKVKGFAKSYSAASLTVGTALVAANTGIAKFLVNLVNTNDEIKKMARETKTSEAEAFRLKSTLDAMDKTMEEIKASPELMKTFKILQKDAESIKIPDMTEGLIRLEIYRRNLPD